MLTESPGMTATVAASEQQSFTPRYLTLVVLFSLELLVISVVRLPESMRFDRYAFCDHGANLTLQYLIAHGLRPSLDFGYHYGLLPALVGRIWFAFFGATPWAYQGAMVVANLLCAWAIAKILSQLKIGAIGLAFAFITLGYSFQATYINFAHAIEAVLLCHALAEQARGSRANALALAAVAIFSKPTMGFVYGLLLVILIARDLGRAGFTRHRLIGAFAPAATVCVSLATLLSLVYGPNTFFHTALPIEGATAYKSMKYGLMGAGHGFWDPKGLPWIYYFIDVAGFWIASTLFLFGATLLQLRNHDQRQVSLRRTEVIVTCAILHLAFLALFFGNQWSWIYYSYFLMIGVALACDLGPAGRRVGLALCALALLSWTDVAYWTYRWWQTTAPDSATAGLWAPAEERNEWLKVRAMTGGQRTLMLDDMGATELLFPGFENPVSLYLTRGLMTRGDIDRKLEQLSGAQVAVVPITISACSGIPDAPEFRDALKDFDLAWSGKHFEVFRRRAAP
jgi:hypothetical protein